jgi:hypothetical protein
MSSATQHDSQPLNGQIKRVFDALSSGQWWTLVELHAVTNDPIPSISAQCRHLRARGHTIRKRRRGAAERGLFEYRLIEPQEAESGNG